MIELPAKYAGRAALSPSESAEIIGLKRATFYRRIMPHVYTGKIQSIKIGGCRRIIATSYLAFLNQEVSDGS
jgi:predicted DNA-binding transcriptional regulator AlpA